MGIPVESVAWLKVQVPIGDLLGGEGAFLLGGGSCVGVADRGVDGTEYIGYGHRYCTHHVWIRV